MSDPLVRNVARGDRQLGILDRLSLISFSDGLYFSKKYKSNT